MTEVLLEFGGRKGEMRGKGRQQLNRFEDTTL